MRRRASTAASLLLALLVAGCVTPPSEAPVATAADAGAIATGTVALERVDHQAELTGCDHADLYIPVATSAVAPYVPDDFEIAVSPSGPNGAPVALAFVGLLRCDHFAAAGIEGRGDFAWLDVAVSPKIDALRSDDRSIYLLRLEHYALPGAMQEVQAMLGDNHTIAETIDVEMSPTAAGFTIVAGDVTLRSEAQTSGVVPAAAFAGVRIREFGFAAGGYTYVDLTVSPAEPTMGAVPATVTTSTGSLAQKILGSEAAGALATARFDFTDGAIGFIPTA